MKLQQALDRKVTSKICIPLILSTICFIARCVWTSNPLFKNALDILNLSASNQEHQAPLNQLQTDIYSDHNGSSQLVDDSGQLTTYVQFIMIMLSIHTIVTYFQEVFHRLILVFRVPQPSKSEYELESIDCRSGSSTPTQDHPKSKSLSSRIKTSMISIVLLIIQYSMIYFVWLTLSTGIYLASKNFHDGFQKTTLINIQESNISQFYSGDTKLNPTQVGNSYNEYDEKFELKKIHNNQSRRALSQSQIINAAEILSYYTYNTSDKGDNIRFSVAPDGETIRFCDGISATYVDISNLTMPQTIFKNQSNIPLGVANVCADSIYSHDGTQELILLPDRIWLLDTSTSKVLRTIILNDLEVLSTDWIAFSPTDEIIYILAFNTSINSSVLYGLDKSSTIPTQVFILPNMTYPPMRLILSSDGEVAYIGIRKPNKIYGFVYFVQISGLVFKKILTFDDFGGVTNFAVSHDDKIMYAFMGDFESFKPIDISGVRVSLYELFTLNYFLIGSSDNTLMTISGDQSVIVLYNNDHIRYLDPIDPSFSMYSSSDLVSNRLSISPDGQTVFAMDTYSKTLQICKLFVSSILNTHNQPNIKATTLNNPDNIYSGMTLAVTSNGSIAISASEGGFEVIYFGDRLNITKRESIYSDVTSLVLSNDDKTAFFTLGDGSDKDNDGLRIVELHKLNRIYTLFNLVADDMKITSDGKFLITKHEEEVKFVNVTNLTAPAILSPKALIPSWTALQILDDIAITLHFDSSDITGNPYITLCNISDIMNIQQCWKPIPDKYLPCSIAISKSRKLLLFIHYNFTSENSIITSHHYLQIYSMPTFTKLGEIEVFSFPFKGDLWTPVLAADSQLCYVTFDTLMYVIDITNPSSPQISNFCDCSASTRDSITKLVVPSNSIQNFVVAGAGKYPIFAVDFTQYTSFNITNNTFFIGSKYDVNVIPMQMNTIGRYKMITNDVQLIKVSNYATSPNYQDLTRSFSIVPSWVTVDSDNCILTLEPTLPYHTGSYQIYVAGSTVVLKETFSESPFKENATDIILSLFAVGYLDSRNYLTSSFNPVQPLQLLNPEYQKVEENIRAILVGCYLEAVLQLNVFSSVSYTLENPLQIVTPSQSSINLKITLSPSNDILSQAPTSPDPCRFVTNLDYGLVTAYNNKATIMTVDGLYFDVNELLRGVRINLDDINSCDAQIYINDHMSPPLQENISGISNYLMNNREPEEINSQGYTLEEEANNLVLYTGSYRPILSLHSRFTDQNLVCTIDNIDQAPWITIDGLSLSGTPPSQFFPFKVIELKLRVSNQYKFKPYSLKIHIRWGFADLLSNLLKLAGLLTIYLYFNLFLNVILQKKYRYP